MTTETEDPLVLQAGATRRRIPLPNDTRPPLKASVFAFGAGISSQLQPMFPYESAGNLVPCVAVMQGVADGNYGQFFHYNTVEEIAVVYGSNNAMLSTGSVFVTQQLHGVNSFLKDPKDPGAFVIITITQHQSEEGDQSEAILFRCQRCSQELVNFPYNATPRDIDGYDPAQWDGSREDHVSMFPTLWGGVEAAKRYNAEEVRTCSGCGHINPEFPEPVWGWSRWLMQQRSVNLAHRALEVAAAEVSDAAG